MRHLFALGGGVTAPTLILMFFLAVACNFSKAENDTDPSKVCVGRCGMIGTVICGNCEYGFTCNTAQYCVEIPGNDVDFWMEEKDEDTVDIDLVDRDMVLTEHEYPDMLEDPYKTSYPDEDRNIAYIYYGDIDIVASDPENVRGQLWDKKFQGPSKPLDECIPVPFDACADHYPHEAQIIENSPIIPGYPDGKCIEKKNVEVATHSCDYLLTPGCWGTFEIGDRLHVSEKNGKFLFGIAGGKVVQTWQAESAYLYDMSTRSAIRYGRAYSEGVVTDDYLFLISSDQSVSSTSNPRQVVYYDFAGNQYGFAYKGAPFYGTSDFRASEKYLFMLAYYETDGSGSDARIIYSKVGEWDKWKELTYKKNTLQGLERRPYFPSMLDNLVAYYDWDYQVTLCDLDKGDSGCRKLTREGETGFTPLIKDANTVYFATSSSTDDFQTFTIKVIEAKINDLTNITYKTLFSFDNMRMNMYDLDDKYLVYNKELVYANGGAPEDSVSVLCYYRFSDGKNICMQEDWDQKSYKLRAFFWKHWLVYETAWNVSKELVVRDMECYCDAYPDQCPFDDYTPKTDGIKALTTTSSVFNKFSNLIDKLW